MRPFSQRALIFIALCAAGAASIVALVQYGSRRHAPPATDAVVSSSDPSRLRASLQGPHVVVVSTTFDERNNHLAVIPLDALEGSRYMTTLACERVYVAGAEGICLQAERGVFTRYYGQLFDESFREQSRFPLKGTPSRARLSRDGRLAAVTVFVNGDSYAANSFSTRTTLIDVAHGGATVDLEEFSVTRDGQPFHRADFNFWGVTFGPEANVFYATLSTGGQMLLVRGDAVSRALAVVHEGVECPSVSPEGMRVAFKKRTIQGGRLMWHLRVLDLRTLAETDVAELRSVDDQVEWLDREQVLYGLPREAPAVGGSDIWVARADGSGTPRLFLKQAYSPAVVR